MRRLTDDGSQSSSVEHAVTRAQASALVLRANASMAGTAAAASGWPRHLGKVLTAGKPLDPMAQGLALVDKPLAMGGLGTAFLGGGGHRERQRPGHQIPECVRSWGGPCVSDDLTTPGQSIAT